MEFPRPAPVVFDVHQTSKTRSLPTTTTINPSNSQWLGKLRKLFARALGMLARLLDERFSAASVKDSMEEQGIVVHRDDLIRLIDNMRSLPKQWRRSIGKHGELLFYVDAC